MAYRYPALARFMSGHWATEAVHIVPVFGERGALFEHVIYNLFYNWPLTIRRRVSGRTRRRAEMKPRTWHFTLCVIIGTAIFSLADFSYSRVLEKLPSLGQIWWLVLIVPILCGCAATLFARGMKMARRISGGALCGVAIGVLYTAASTLLGQHFGYEIASPIITGMWRVFIFTILSTIGVLLTEMRLPEEWKH
jgi:Na+/proline symporter